MWKKRIFLSRRLDINNKATPREDLENEIKELEKKSESVTRKQYVITERYNLGNL